jgi:transcription elongation factor GreA
MSKTDKVMLTQEGFDNLLEELEEAKSQRHKVAKRLEDAIALGDLSENAEYQEAKDAQAFLDARIIELQGAIKNAEIIKKNKTTTNVHIGSTVTLREKGEDSDVTYTIVGKMEVDSLVGKISNESPLGEVVLGKKVGDICKFNAPSGAMEYSILKIQ